MIGDAIFEEAERLKVMAEAFPNPVTKAALLQASAILFQHLALALESEAKHLREGA